jgi:Alginate export
MVFAALAISTVVGARASAQSTAETEQPDRRPQYQPLRYEEDWRALRDRSQRTDFWDPLKYFELNERGWYLSLGGESRIRYEALRNAAFGSGTQDSNGYVLQRHLAHIDVHAGQHLRLFTEIQSGLETGRAGGPRPTDEDSLEFHQGFAELSMGRSPRSFTLRVGRQEVAFGSGRLISPSEGRNVRRSFDAVRPIVRLGPWTWNALLAKLVAVAPGMFDDGREPGQIFGGVGFIRTRSRPEEGTSGYYLRLDRRDAQFDQGTGQEVRHTLGSRTWGHWAEIDYNYELIFQWGAFGGAPIRAWALATDTGYQLRSLRWPTRIGLRAAVTTGDRRKDDPVLQSFNPLFPGTAYSGRVGLVGPANSIDVTPSVRVAVSRKLTVTIDQAWYRRHSVHDGLYGIGMNLIRHGGDSRARKVGRQLTMQADFRIDDHLTLSVTSTTFFVDRFLRETPPGSDVTFVGVSSAYRF